MRLLTKLLPLLLFFGQAIGQITKTNLTNGTSEADTDTYVSASISPSANKLILITIHGFGNAAAATAMTSVTGNGLTWDQRGCQNWANSDRAILCHYTSMSSSAPSSGAITFVFDQQQAYARWDIQEYDNIPLGGVRGDDAHVKTQCANGNNALCQKNMISFLTGSAAVGACQMATAGIDGTAGTGLTDINITAADKHLHTVWVADAGDLGDGVVDVSLDGSDAWGFCGTEIALVSSGSTAGARGHRLGFTF